MITESLRSGTLSRREFIKAGMGFGAALAVSGMDLKDVANFSRLSCEYGPEVAVAIIKHPGQALEAYRLWQIPEKTYKKSQLLKNSLEYRRGAANNIIGFGDSNMVGPDGTRWQESPIILYKDLVREQLGFDNWNDYNCAKGGYTIDMIIDKQIRSDRAKKGLEMGVKCDVWVNAGGNDMSSIVSNEKEVAELTRLASDPFGDMNLLFKYTERIEGKINAFESRFLDLLHAINQPEYAPNIRQFVVMSAPDFGKIESIKTQEVNGNAYVISLKSSVTRRLVENISVHMNNAMFRATTRFQAEEGIRMIGIDTATPAMSDFSSNQHFSKKACVAIAETAFSRIAVAP